MHRVAVATYHIVEHLLEDVERLLFVWLWDRHVATPPGLYLLNGSSDEAQAEKK